MNWILVCLFNLLLFNSCLTANLDRLPSNSDIQQQNQTENGVEIKAFNEDFMFPVFDLAELEEIVKLAKDPRTAEFVQNHVFPAKYQNYEFKLLIENNAHADEHAGTFYIHDFNLFVDVITYFGKYIKKMCIIRPEMLSEEESALLYRSMSEHCSESLTSIQLHTITQDSFKHFTKPFPNVKILYLGMQTDTVGSDLPLDDLFPNLEFLRINYYEDNVIEDNDNRFIDYELPAMENLKHFQVYMSLYYNPAGILQSINKQLGNMMQKNPQIERLLYGWYLNDFIQEIKEYLPNLKHFTTRAVGANIPPVHFESVKYFKMWLREPCPIERVSFSHLDTLEMDYGRDHLNESARDSWIAFFRKHQNIRQLNLEAWESDGLLEFLDEIHNVEEIRIESFGGFDMNIILRSIERDNLKIIRFTANVFDPNLYPDIDDLRERFENEWKITHRYIGRPFIQFERKN